MTAASARAKTRRSLIGASSFSRLCASQPRSGSCPRNPMRKTPLSSARLAGVAGAVERVLETFLADAPRPGEIARPPRLMAAMRHAALAGGKRLRPVPRRRDRPPPRARRPRHRAGRRRGRAPARYSLVHDDLPAMDDDDLRRGKPTVHKRLRRGDGDPRRRRAAGARLRALADPATHRRPRGRARARPRLARAGGLAGMAGGQMLDLAAEGATATPPRARRAIRRLQAMKTGALLAFAVEPGAILGRARDAATRAALARLWAGARRRLPDRRRPPRRRAAPMRSASAPARTPRRARRRSSTRSASSRRGAECERLVGAALDALERFGAGAEVLRQAARFTAARRT